LSKSGLAGSEYLRPSPHPPGVLAELGITISHGLLVGDQSFTQYDGGYCTRSAAYRELEVSLREDIGHGHNRVVGRMVKALKQEDGITRVIREDREVHLVATPTRTDRLQEWVSSYREDKIRD
jgi:hypothetical protein